MAGTKKQPTKKTVKPGKDLVESTVEDFKEKLLKIVNQGTKVLSIDMKNVNNVDSTGLGVLIAAKNSLNQSGGQLILKGAPEDIGSFLQALGLEDFFEISST